MQKLLNFLIFVFVFSLSSCVNDLDMNKLNKEVEIGTSLVIPVGHSRATIFDVFNMFDNDGPTPHWLADSAGNFVYLYLNTVLNLPADTCKTFDLSSSGNNHYSFRNDADSWFVGGTVLVGPSAPHTQKPKITEVFDYDYNKTEGGRVTQRLDEVKIAGAKLNITIDLQEITFAGGSPNTFIELIFKIPDIDFEETIKISNADGSNIHLTPPPFIIGPKTILFPPHASTTDMSIEAKFYTTGTAMHTITFGANADIKVNVTQTEISVLEAWGYFNRRERVTGDRIYAEIPTDLFGSKLITNNRLLFHNPQIIFDVSNNIGVPLSFIVDSIKAVDEYGAVRRARFNGSNAFNNGISTKVPIKVPTAAQFGQMVDTTIMFDRINGGTNQLFEINPEKFIYDFHVAIDSLKAEQSYNLSKPHFLARPLKVKMDVKAKLQFWFDENTKYESRDTVKLNNSLGDMLKIKDKNGKTILEIEPERVTINIDFKNHLPVQVIGKAIFLSENNEVLHEEKDILIQCPDVYPVTSDNDPQGGMVISEKVFSLKISLVDNNAEQLLKTKSIVFVYTGTAKSPATDRINVRGTDFLDAVVSLFIKGKIKGDLGK